MVRASLSQVDQLLQSGLVPKSDISKLSYYRIIMTDPHQAIYSMIYRDRAIQTYSKLLGLLLNDSVLYNRLRQLLLAKTRNEETDWNSDDLELGTNKYKELTTKLTPGQTIETVKKVMKNVRKK